MVIKPSSAIRNNYRQVADYCMETGEPVFLTNNGEGELVVMSIRAWQENRQQTKTEEALLEIEANKRAGIARYVDASEVLSNMREIIEQAEGGRHNE